VWFAWYLILRKTQKTPITFFVGEFIKIALTIVLLVVVVRVFKQIHWLAFIVGFVVVLKSYLILLLRKRL
jgi:ATP synthase protein I